MTLPIIRGVRCTAALVTLVAQKADGRERHAAVQREGQA